MTVHHKDYWLPEAPPLEFEDPVEKVPLTSLATFACSKSYHVGVYWGPKIVGADAKPPQLRDRVRLQSMPLP